MTPVARLVFSAFGLVLCAVLVTSRGDRLTDDIIALEFAVFGALFFLWWGWTAIRDLRRGSE